MPEIAEVALMVKAINDILSGKKLKNIEVLGGRYFKDNRSVLDNHETLLGLLPLEILSVNVKGKFGWIELSKDWYIAITFGMSGSIYYEPDDDVVNRDEYMKHFHIKFISDDDQCFYFGDPRRFGTINLSNNRQDLQKKLDNLGPDMLTGPPISDLEFIQIFRRRIFSDKNICRVLMEQRAVSGVGNYIKAEVLYECHINPWALVSDLDDQTLSLLHQSIRSIAHKAYIGHGASLYTYTGIRREKGTFQDMLKVYGKTTDPQGQSVITIPDKQSPDKRTTHYVPSVQIIGSHRDPNNLNREKIVIRVKKVI